MKMDITPINATSVLIHVMEDDCLVVYIVEPDNIVYRRVIVDMWSIKRYYSRFTDRAVSFLPVDHGWSLDDFSVIFAAFVKAVLLTMLILALIYGRFDIVQVIVRLLGFDV